MRDGEETEETGYLPIEPGMRVVIEYDGPSASLDAILFGGPGNVAHVINDWTADIRRDADGMVRTYCRWLLRAE